MGELIRYEAAAAPMAFSGERLTGAISGQVEIEHYHRYLLARDFCRGRDVLDVASGEGYGSALLAQVARSVIGVEIDAAVVRAATAEFNRPNLRFEKGDARALPLPDACIDVAVSFETLEHLAEQDLFLGELKRVLRPGGLVFVSTPDRDAYSPVGVMPNPYHVLELTRGEFEALLARHFAHAAVAAQRAVIGSVIVGTSGAGPARAFERRSPALVEASDHFARAPYLFGIASEAALPAVPSSVYVHRSDLDTDPRMRLEAETARLAAEQAVSEAETRLAEQAGRASTAERAASDAERATTVAEQAVSEAEARLIEQAERISAAEQAARNAEQQAQEATAQLVAAETQLAMLNQQCVAAVERGEAAAVRERHAQQVIDDAQRELTELKREAAELRREAAAQERMMDAEREQRRQTLSALAEASEQAERAAVTSASRTGLDAQRVGEAHAEAEALRRRLLALETSTAWRLTQPLRRLGERSPGLALALRRGVKLAWWAASFQLTRRYRAWHQYRHLLQNSTVIAAATPALSPESPPIAPSSGPDALPMPLPVAEPAEPALQVPSSDHPDVSLIISTYGQLIATLACLQSIADHAPRCPIEVIVVDDAYAGDEDMGALHRVGGIILLRHAGNLGFLRSCNAAARMARGRYLHFLNNDTQLQPGSIDALVELLEARPDAAMAGSKLLFADRRLQEAGGIVWNDASAWNFGRGDDPSRPEYNYLREPDYCSGASLMVRRDCFEALGGFDEAFIPAYYEDADLAFRLRAQGHRVFYEPRSVVIHHEGVSHGTDLAIGLKANQAINQLVMRDRWAATLQREHYPNATSMLRARDRARRRKIVLVIDHYVLEPDRDAGSRSTMGIIECLLDAGWVVKFWPLNRLYHPVYTAAMEHLGIEVLDQRRPGDLKTWLTEHGEALDHLLVNRPDAAAEVLPQLMWHADAVLSYYGVDLHFERLRREAELTGDPVRRREAATMERLERRVWQNFDVVMYPSKEETATVCAMSPETLVRDIVPFWSAAYAPREAPPARLSILFVAGFAHPPNVDAALFLIRQIIPALRQELGSVSVVLAGSNPTETVRALAGLEVEVTGYVTEEELDSLYRRHRVAIVPLRFGAGVKGKVVGALSRGLPLITTSIGSQGIPGLAAIVPVRDDVPGIVAALKRLLIDDDAWMAQSAAQLGFAQSVFSRQAMQHSIIAALEAGEARVHDRSLKPVTPQPNPGLLPEEAVEPLTSLAMGAE